MEEVIYKYFPQITSVQKEQISALMPLYREWNKRINVISRTDTGELYLHHVLHSLAIAKVCDLSGSTVLDVGTGGGFPGIPLAIIFPDARFLLVDSVAKKIKVTSAIASSLGLQNVTTAVARVEELDIAHFFSSYRRGEIPVQNSSGALQSSLRKEPPRFSYVVARAVARLSALIPLVRGLYSEGMILLKGGSLLSGGELDSEIAEAVSKYNISGNDLKIFNISDYFAEEYFKEKRVLIVPPVG